MSRFREIVSHVLASALTIFAVSWAAGFGATLGLQLYDEQYAASILGVALALAQKIYQQHSSFDEDEILENERK